MQYAQISSQFKFFCGGDIHSDKSYFKVLDQSGKVVLKKNLPNNFALLKDFLKPVMGDVAIGVESNYNYYWIADGCAKGDIPFFLGHAYYMKAIAANKNKGKVITRFPPEPNGYLHIGHAKSIVLNFGIAKSFSGLCNLRFDDTNPEKEDQEYIEAIKQDIQWLGYEWHELCFSSDYFDQLYNFAEQLIQAGKAYVDDLDAAQIRATRGTLTEPGEESPHRQRTIEDNLDLFKSMHAGD